jgi:hypothetical protein
VSDDLMTAAFTPFYIRRKVEGETLAEFVKRIRANPPAGPLFEDQEPSHRGPGRRDRRRLCTWCHQPFEYSRPRQTTCGRSCGGKVGAKP